MSFKWFYCYSFILLWNSFQITFSWFLLCIFQSLQLHDIAKILLKSVLNINQSICHCDDQMQSMPINIKVVTFFSGELDSCSWRDVLDTTLCDKVCQWLKAGQSISQGTPISSNNKTECHNITKKLLNWFLLMVRCTWYNIMRQSLSVTYDRTVVFSG